jgi:hypothetical protein
VPDSIPLDPWQDKRVEGGFSCIENTYYYPIKSEGVIASKKFSVKGVGNRAVT